MADVSGAARRRGRVPTGRTIAVFSKSHAPTLRFIWACFVVAVACALLATGVIEIEPLRPFQPFAFVGMLMFGLGIVGGVIWLTRFKPILEVTTEGLRDRRLSTDIIPWAGIASVTVSDRRRRQVLQLSINVEVADRMMRTRAQTSQMKGRDVSISMVGLSGTFDDLIAALRRVEAETRR